MPEKEKTKPLPNPPGEEQETFRPRPVDDEFLDDLDEAIDKAEEQSQRGRKSGQ